MELDKKTLNKYLNKEEFKIKITSKRLSQIFTKTFNRTKKIFSEIINNKKTGLEKSSHKEDINPILWQCGHIVYFYIKHCSDYFTYDNKGDNIIDFYDSYLTKLEFRYNEENLLKMNILLNKFQNFYNSIMKQLKSLQLNHMEKYVLLLSILHNEMSIEALIFSGLNLDYSLPNFISLRLTNLSLRSFNKNILTNIKFINIKCKIFIQGSKNSSYYLSFDNERPAFRKYLEDYYISEYPITEYQFLQFILEGGYENKIYWTEESWKWIKSKNIYCPIYWSLDNLKYRETNYPVCNISWYEAKAYCKWAGYRLPTESEWECVASNYGRYKYPWGDKMDSSYCNLNYTINGPLEINDNRLNKEQSYTGVKQLIGNVWEWCEDSIYPYNGFSIDPLYRELSYPYYGFKKICRGGSFAVPDYLIHSSYRNSQMPDCRLQFIGFRVCKDINFKKIRNKRRNIMGLCTDI
jgi:ergothioneine biosynthesis protein EgtB